MAGNFFKIGTIERKCAITLTRVVTNEEAFEIAKTEKRIFTIAKPNPETGFYDFAFVDCHGVPPHLNSSEWIPATHPFPSYPVAREGLEDGVVDTIEKFIFIYHKDDTQLHDFDRPDRLTTKQFFDWYANFCANYNEEDLGKVFRNDYDMCNSYLEELSHKQAFWYIATNYVIIE